MSLIFDNLIVGSLDDAFDSHILELHAVTHILNVASEININERVHRVYMKHGVDDDDISEYIPRIFHLTNEFISKAVHVIDGVRGCVFVHCLEGKSRSVCVCIAFMVCVLGYTFDDAYKKIKSCRDCIDIFPLYLSQTAEYCQTIKQYIKT